MGVEPRFRRHRGTRDGSAPHAPIVVSRSLSPCLRPLYGTGLPGFSALLPQHPVCSVWFLGRSFGRAPGAQASGTPPCVQSQDLNRHEEFPEGPWFWGFTLPTCGPGFGAQHPAPKATGTGAVRSSVQTTRRCPGRRPSTTHASPSTRLKTTGTRT